MGKRTVLISVWLEIDEPAAVLKAGRENARSKGFPPGSIRNAVDAAHWLVDPGSVPGCTVIETTVEERNHGLA